MILETLRNDKKWAINDQEMKMTKAEMMENDVKWP